MIKKKDSFFDSAFKYATQGMEIIDLKGNCVDVNNEVCRLSGFSREKLLTKRNRNGEKCFLNELKILTPLINNELPNLKYSITYSDVNMVERDFAINAIALYDNGTDNKVTHILKYYDKEILADHLVEHTDSKHKLVSKVLDEMPINVYLKDLNSKYTVVNNEVARCLGVDSSNELIGKTAYDFYPRDIAQRKMEIEQQVIVSGREYK